MKRMLRKWLGIDIDHMPSAPVEARDVLSGTEMAFVAYRIDNGYLLRMGGGLTLQNAVIYCADERDMVEKIIVHRTKARVIGTAGYINKTPSVYAQNAHNKV